MGFKSVMKKVGKVALKVAPYAAMAIPGVGIPLGMAISGGLNAANKKISGGSWKDALVSGGIGAATSAIGGKIPGVGKVLDKVPGLGPSNPASFVKGAVSGIENNVANAGKKGIGSILGNVGKQVGQGILKNPTSIPGIIGAAAGSRQPSVISDDPMNGGIMGNAAIPRSSFGDAMSAGRNAAYASQPWRKEPQLPIYDPNKRRQLY